MFSLVYATQSPFRLENDILDKVRKSNVTSGNTLLSDYKNFTSVFGGKNVGLQITKAAIIASTKVMIEFNKHELIVGEKIKNKEKFVEFDVIGEMEKNIPFFQERFVQFFVTSVIRKAYDLAAILNYPVKLVDLLSKDIRKSILRKLERSKYLNQTTYSLMAQIYQTAMWNSSLTYLSMLTYDILYTISYNLGQTVYSMICIDDEDLKPVTKKKLESDVNQLVSRPRSTAAILASRFSYSVVWIAKKSCFYVICWCSSSAGMSLFSMAPYYPGTSATIGGFVLETICGSVASLILQLD